MFSRLLLSAWPSSRVTTYSRFFTKLFRLSPYDATIRANSLNCSNRTILGRRIGRGSTSLIVASCSASSHDYSPSPRPATLYSQRERERERERENVALGGSGNSPFARRSEASKSPRESSVLGAISREYHPRISLPPAPLSLRLPHPHRDAPVTAARNTIIRRSLFGKAYSIFRYASGARSSLGGQPLLRRCVNASK